MNGDALGNRQELLQHLPINQHNNMKCLSNINK